MYTMPRFLLPVAIAILALPGKAQQPPVPQQTPEQVSIISFFAEVNPATVNQLVQVVNGQVRSNVRKITLLVSSTGGQTDGAFTLYNFLRGISAEVTTFNVGVVDSAALVLFCSGRHRYSLPGTRFLIHGNTMDLSGNFRFDATALESNLQLIKNLNQTVVTVLVSNTNKTQSELETMVRGQTILTAEQARDWHLIEEIRTEFMQPGAIMVSINAPATPSPTEPPLRISSGQ
jgi:ATP-dependent Clp protease protease subunit